MQSICACSVRLPGFRNHCCGHTKQQRVHTRVDTELLFCSDLFVFCVLPTVNPGLASERCCRASFVARIHMKYVQLVCTPFSVSARAHKSVVPGVRSRFTVVVVVAARRRFGAATLMRASSWRLIYATTTAHTQPHTHTSYSPARLDVYANGVGRNM